ncbi:family 2 encapsulin nanocompartment cargo protein terpene cyclase [Nocardia sp. NPDC051052]|uniref:family 2 encapsulin nanocompartment cargo protein terpene cyclase n=1 Tax=Nocardia sp. NPDC051052 TaxID=3364322 RepID=UPI00379451A9
MEGRAMSMLSRTLALPATHEVATAVAALLSDLGGGAPIALAHTDLFSPDGTPAPDRPETPPSAGPEAPAPGRPGAPAPDGPAIPTPGGHAIPTAQAAAIPTAEALGTPAPSGHAAPTAQAPETPAPDRKRILGPTGLGTATLLITPPIATPGSVVPPVISTTASAPPRVTTSAPAIGERGATSTERRIPTGPTGLGTASTRRSSSDTSIPALYCPPPMRDDPVLAATVNELILAWASSIGLYEGKMDDLRDADFGRLIMLAHPDCDDPDRLLAAAKCAVTEWAIDDYYCDADADDTAPDGTPSTAAAELGPRLELAAAAIDPVHLPARYAARLEQAMEADPILRAFRSGFAHVAEYATPAQVARLRTEIAGWFIALGAEAGWRQAGRKPQAWEYLTNRQPHSFLPCMAPIDVVGGYELQPAEYTDPRVRRVITTAALASQLVNDLYSMAREDLSDGREFNLPTVLVAEEGCTRREAVLRTAELHDELMHRFELEAAPLAASGSAELSRHLTGVWAWLGGSRAWHADSKRYT